MSQPEDRHSGAPEPGRGQAPESSAGTVPPDLYEAVQVEIAKYPNRRAAILPALRLAQERYGWLLAAEALRAVSDAMDFSPPTASRWPRSTTCSSSSPWAPT